jgi:hypothetical protein
MYMCVCLLRVHIFLHARAGSHHMTLDIENICSHQTTLPHTHTLTNTYMQDPRHTSGAPTWTLIYRTNKALLYREGFDGNTLDPEPETLNRNPKPKHYFTGGI